MRPSRNPVPMDDLEPYFDRIDYHGSREPTLQVLHALTRAHAQSIPFENIDAFLGRPIRLDLESVFHKLVVSSRGGYCFEQNGLFMHVLTRLGFHVRPLRAAVRLGVTDRSLDVKHTHLLLEVRIDGETWLTDVGVGAASLTAALRLAADIEQTTPHDLRRLDRGNDRWYHQIRHGEAWVDVYEFDGSLMPLPDRVVANWYTSTCPDSKFRLNLFAARALPDGGRASLQNRVLTLRQADGTADTRILLDPDQLPDTLRKYFGIRLAEGTRIDPPACPSDGGRG